MKVIASQATWVCPECPSQRDHGDMHSQVGFHDRTQRCTALALRDFHLGMSTPIRQIPEKCIASEEEHRELFNFLEALLIFHVPGCDTLGQEPLQGLKLLKIQSVAALKS